MSKKYTEKMMKKNEQSYVMIGNGTTFSILSRTSGGTVNEIIGFDSVTSYSSTGNILVSEHSASLTGIKILNVSSSVLRTSGLSSGGVIPVNAVAGGLILYTNNSGQKGALLRNKEISTIDITITDENNRYVNFNDTMILNIA